MTTARYAERRCVQGGIISAENAVRRWMEGSEVWLIDANRLYDAAEEKYMEDRSKTDNVIARAMLSDARRRIQMLIAYAPSVDAIPVVRCKDCKYFGRELENGKHGCTDFNLPYCRPDDFCSHGVQKEATSTDE